MIVRVIPSFLRPDAKVVLRLSCFSQNIQPKDDEEFLPLNLRHVKGQTALKKRFKRPEALQPRSKLMAVDQDWGSVWPGPRTFHPAVVPLPIRQGYSEKGAPPGKYANAELMKIPNFLHLTPPVIKRQCEALKKFCTEWPKGLESEEKMEEHFPLQIISSNYCHSSPTIRDPMARIVTLKIKLSSLELDSHAKDKLRRLVDEKYDEETDTLTIVTDRCPMRKQNYDHAMYLLTALFHESWNIEEWEKTKSEADMECYIWENSASKKNIDAMGVENIDSSYLGSYKNSVEQLFNEGENSYTWNSYSETVRKMLRLPDKVQSN